MNNVFEAATLQELIEAASQGIVIIDERGTILLVNEKSEELFGYARHELVGQNLDLLLPEGSRDNHTRYVAEYFHAPRKRPMGLGLDLAGKRKDGSEFPLEISLSYIDQGGRRLAFALITDISDRKRLEERLLESQRLETAGLLAGGVAHDFNNLLVGIMGNASLVLEGMPEDDPNRSLMQALIKASERAAELTRQLLAYAGKARFVLKPLHVNRLVQESQGLLHSATPRHVAVKLDLARDLPPVEADATLLRQVLMSLFTNAVESIPEETGGTIWIQTASEDGGVYLRVRDTGCGMDAEMQNRIFDPFFTTKFMGRGLGLSAALGIVRSHGGDIQVSSQPRGGTTFTVRLPARSQPPDQLAGKSAIAAPVNPVVLVVDDEEVVRNLARTALERRGYTVLTAENGQECLEVFHNHRQNIAAVLLDLTMPVMGGEEVLARLRQVRAEVPVVLSSGYTESEATRLFGGKGLAGFIQKPYLPSHLVETIRQVI